MNRFISRLAGFVRMYRGLPRSIYVLFFSRIVNSIGNFVFPFLTLFLTDKLGYADKKAGFIVFLTGIFFAAGSLVGGKLADHLGRKKILISAFSISALIYLLGGWLFPHPLMVGLILFSIFFQGIAMPAGHSAVIDLSVPENRKAAMSLLYLGHNIGFAVGPMLAGFLYKHYVRVLFWGDAATTLLSLLLIGLFVKETIPSHEKIQASLQSDSTEKAERGNLLTAFLTRPFLLFYILLAPFYSFVYAQTLFSLPIFYERGVQGKRCPSLWPAYGF